MTIKFVKPHHKTEANLQAEFYHQCRTVNILPYLEYSHEGCRFDCVIIDGEDIIAIVEIKRSYTAARNKKSRRQVRTYNYYSNNTPVFLVAHKFDIHKIISKIQKIRKTRKKSGKSVRKDASYSLVCYD